MNKPTMREDSSAWFFFVWVSFIVSVLLMCVGIYYVPANVWIRAYLGMGLFFAVGSTFTLAKTVRDQHELQKLINRINEAKTERILSDFEMKT